MDTYSHVTAKIKNSAMSKFENHSISKFTNTL